MATYYTNPNNQRDNTPMFYARENMPGSYPETSNTMMMYMNSGSFSDPQQQPNNTQVLAMEGQDSAPPQQEILSILGGSRIGEHEYSTWADGRNEMLLMQSVGASTGMLEGQGTLQGQGLSLSLSTRIPSGIQIPSFPYRGHNQDFGSLLSPNASVSGGNQDLQKGDLSPYAMPSAARNIPGSKYLKAAQELLDEVVNVRKALKQNVTEKNKNEELEKSSKEGDGGSKNEGSASGVPSNPQESTSSTSELSHAERQDLQNKLTKLLSMLDEVDRRYKQYYHQMQIVVSSFDAIAGCGAAKPYTALALQTISRHFRCLRDAITGQIRAARKSLGEQDASGNSKGVGISRLRFVDQQLRQQRALQQLGMMQQHAWRPQRGLPESSVSILRAWLFEHFLHPYPKDSDKIMLARQTGLTRSQVSNWFINARVRLWKPMVEEMYKEEAGDAEMESNSSSDNAGKATRGDTGTSEGRGEDNNHQSMSSAAAERCSIGPEIEMAGSTSFHNRPGGDAEAEYGLLRLRAEERPGMDDCSLFPDSMVQSAYQMPEMGSGVSLTLGLQHCDGANLPSSMAHHGFVPMRSDDMYNNAASSVGHEAGDFECIDGGNRQHRFNSAQMLHDFVA